MILTDTLRYSKQKNAGEKPQDKLIKLTSFESFDTYDVTNKRIPASLIMWYWEFRVISVLYKYKRPKIKEQFQMKKFLGYF